MSSSVIIPPKHPPVHRHLQPEGWPEPRGYAHGVSARGRFVVLGGQIGWDASARLQEGFVAQCRQALANIRSLLETAGGGPEHLVRMTWYVTDMDAYTRSLREIGQVYRDELGRNFPAMALVQVVRLVEADALVEIEATAVLPD